LYKENVKATLEATKGNKIVEEDVQPEVQPAKKRGSLVLAKKKVNPTV